MIDYNLILYIGLGFITLGFLLFVVAVNMEIYYDRKLYRLEQKRKKWKE
jgi:hypothetical protein